MTGRSQGRALPAGWRSRMLATLGAVLLGAPTHAATVPEPLEHFPRSTLTIEGRGPRHPFSVWIAATPARHEQGLMFVKQLRPDQGMLFLFDPPQLTSFWMKNTRLALDMLFIGVDGRIIRIVENAEPGSLEPIASMGVVAAVLEIRGGTARGLGLATGNHVTLPEAAH